MFGKLCFISVTINKTPNMSKIYSPMLTRHASLIYNFVGSINNTPNPYTVLLIDKMEHKSNETTLNNGFLEQFRSIGAK